MSASSDRTARLRYCNTEGQGKTSCCYPKLIGIDPANNVVCLDPDCSTIVTDISGQTVVASLDTADGIGDAFGRLRVSNPYTLFEFSSITGLNPLLIDSQTNAGGAYTLNSTQSYVALTVPAVSGAYVIRQSHEYITYQPGKSKLVFMTGVLTVSDVPNTDARIGCFDDEMGVFVQKSNGSVSVVMRYGGLDTVVPQASWSETPLLTADFNKAQIFVFDFEWLGVGQVRCGLVINGELVYYHKFQHFNTLTAPYIPMAKLPLRYELRSTGGGLAEMRMICGTVISEGGLTPTGRDYTFGRFTAALQVPITVSDTFVPLLAIRLRSTGRFPRVTVKLKKVDIFDTTNNTWGAWKLLLNPTIVGTPTWAPVDAATESAVEGSLDITTCTVTGGTILYSDYYITRTNSVIATTTDELVAAYPITTGLSGVPDTVVLVANNITSGGGGNTAYLLAFLKWIEFI